MLISCSHPATPFGENSIPQPKKLNRAIVSLLEALSNKNESPLLLLSPPTIPHTRHQQNLNMRGFSGGGDSL